MLSAIFFSTREVARSGTIGAASKKWTAVQDTSTTSVIGAVGSVVSLRSDSAESRDDIVFCC